MKMNEYLTVLQTHLNTQQPNYPYNAESILALLYDAYNDTTGMDNATIKAHFEELYQLMKGKPLKNNCSVFRNDEINLVNKHRL